MGKQLVVAVLLSCAAGVVLDAFPGSAFAAEAGVAPVADDPAKQIVRLYNDGDYDQAIALSEAWIARIRRDPAQAQRLPSALSSYGAILIELERFADAERALKEAVAQGETTLGKNSGTTLTAMNNLAACYLRQDKNAEALPVYEELVARRSAALGKDNLLGWQAYDPGLVSAVVDLATVRLSLGQGGKAMADLASRFDEFNSGVDDNGLRADFLEAAADVFADQGKLADLVKPASEFVSRSGAVSSLARHPYSSDKSNLPDLDIDDDVERQKDVLRRSYLAAGMTTEEHDLALSMPNRLFRLSRDKQDAGDPEGALALYVEAADRMTAQCASYCPSEEIYRDILLDQEFALEDSGLDHAAELTVNLERQALLAERRFGKISARAAEAWDKLAVNLTAAGRAGDAELASFRAEIARGAKDPEFGNATELALARKLVAAGRDGDAEAIYRKEMECGFGPAFEGDTADRATPCSSALLAMHEFSALLERKGRKADAEFFRLPHEIVTAYLASDDKAAHARSERLLVLAGKRYAPQDRYYRMAMGIFDEVHAWYDLPLYDIPKAWRLCGRWDEPEPVRVNDATSSMPMPVMVSTAPPARYFSLSDRYLSPEDPRRIFYHSITNKAGRSFASYMQQCLFAGDARGAARFGQWAEGEARRMGYPVSDRFDLILPLARAQRQAGDFTASEKTYLDLVTFYLNGKENTPPFGGEKIYDELIQFYGYTGRTEKLQALVLQMVESDKFANPAAQVALRKMLFELFIIAGDTANAEKMLAGLDPYTVLYSQGRATGLSPADDPTKDVEAMSMARTVYIASYARLQLAKGDEAEAVKALDFGLEENRKARAGNAAPIDGQNPMGEIFATLPDGILTAIKASIIAKHEDYAGALVMLESNPALKLYDTLFAQLAPELANLSEGDQRELQDDGSEGGKLFQSARTLYATLAQIALRADQPGKAAEWLDKARMIPAVGAGGPNVLEQIVQWSGVAVGISDPARRAAGLKDARKLADTLEQLWAIGNSSSLDNQYKRDAVREAPQYFGDIAALEWRARVAGDPGIDDSAAFLHVQRAIMDVVDLTIAAQTGRAIIARDRPDLLPLLDEREQLSQALLPAAGVETGIGQTGDARLQIEGFAPGGIDARLSRVAEIDAVLTKEAPQYLALTSTLPVPLSEARAMLSPEEAILLVAPGTYGTQVMLLTSDGLDWRESPLDVDAMRAKVRRLRWFLGGDVAATAEETKLWFAAVAGGRNGFDRQTSHELYNELIAPFADRLVGRRKLFVAAGGPLTSLPFGVLVARIAEGADDSPDALRATQWLGDSFALVQMSTAEQKSAIRRRKTRPSCYMPGGVA